MGSNKYIIPAGIMGYYGYNCCCGIIGCLSGMMVLGGIGEFIDDQICKPFNDHAVNLNVNVYDSGVTLTCDTQCPMITAPAEGEGAEAEQASEDNADEENGCMIHSTRDKMDCPCKPTRPVRITFPNNDFPAATGESTSQTDPNIGYCSKLYWNGGAPDTSSELTTWMTSWPNPVASSAVAGDDAISEAWLDMDTLLVGSTKQEFKDWCAELVEHFNGGSFFCILGAVFSCLCCACLCGGGGFMFKKGQDEANS
jgi:hypothetical protein